MADGGIDDRVNNVAPQSILKEFIIEPRLRQLLSGWCIDNSSFSIHALNNDDDQGKKWFYYCIYLSLFLNKHKIESTGFISNNLDTNRLLESIMQVYSSYFSLEQAFIKDKS